MATYAVVATAKDYRLLRYSPPQPDKGKDATLFVSSPQTLPLADRNTDPTSAIRRLVCKLAGIMCRQAEETERATDGLGLHEKLGVLPDALDGAYVRQAVRDCGSVISCVCMRCADTRCAGWHHFHVCVCLNQRVRAGVCTSRLHVVHLHLTVCCLLRVMVTLIASAPHIPYDVLTHRCARVCGHTYLCRRGQQPAAAAAGCHKRP